MKFSIAIPAYKCTYIKEAIDSCLAQTFRDFELIIVNDASPEDLDSIVSTYSDSRIRYYKNEKNYGAENVVDNWNKCLEYAEGDYIICMGDDDKLLPCCLEEYVKLMDKFPGLGVYHAWTEIIDENGDFCKLQHPRPIYEGAYSLCWNRWNGRTMQYIGDFCFEKKMLCGEGGFYKLPMAWASDDISAVRAAQKKGIANTQVPCFQYRVNRYSITSIGSMKIKIEATKKEKEWYEAFSQEYVPLSDVELKYRNMVLLEIDRYFIDKYKQEIALDIVYKPYRFYYWLCRRKEFNMPIYKVIVAFVIAVGRKLNMTK